MRSGIVADLESRADCITASLKRPEAAALASVAEIGLDAEEAQSRIRAIATAERAIAVLRAARGSSLALTRPEAAALVAVAESALALATSPRGLFAAAFEGIDLAAVRRGLDQVRGALR